MLYALFQGFLCFRAVVKTGFISVSWEMLTFTGDSIRVLSAGIISFVHSISFGPRPTKFQAWH